MFARDDLPRKLLVLLRHFVAFRVPRTRRQHRFGCPATTLVKRMSIEIKVDLHIGRSEDEPVIEESGQLSSLSQARLRLSGGVRGAQGETRRLRLRTYNLTHDDGMKK
jgi:hypothetical protein